VKIITRGKITKFLTTKTKKSGGSGGGLDATKRSSKPLLHVSVSLLKGERKSEDNENYSWASNTYKRRIEGTPRTVGDVGELDF